MGSEIGPAASIQEKVAEKIRASFLDLIPEETFAAMVKAELHRFTSESQDRWNKAEPSPLGQMIQAEIKARMAQAIKLELDKPEYATQWTDRQGQISTAALAIAREMAPELIQSLFASVIQQAIVGARNSLIR